MIHTCGKCKDLNNHFLLIYYSAGILVLFIRVMRGKNSGQNKVQYINNLITANSSILQTEDHHHEVAASL